jgi:7,8-dihydroneopterin aldolase/epimerase/oxygenase
MTDAVFVTGLSLHAYHGVMQHEGRVGQTFSLDLVLDTDLTEASRSDKLADTVGYDQVVEIASKAFGARRYRLVEAAAGAVAAAVLERFPRVARVRVTVHKPTRRSRRPLPMSGSPSCALASVSDVATGACRQWIATRGTGH